MRVTHAAAVGMALSISVSAQPPAPPPADLTKPTLYVVGYAHLDTQWRWSYADTIREYIPNTLRDNFKLFEKYPHYVFNFSGSRRYRMMEEYYPEDFAKLKGYVDKGQWFPCGSSVDENDANVPSAESLVRHVLYGNKYFLAKFGVASDEYMLPDCFGFPAALPSVLAHCGIKGFSTQKLTWGLAIGKPPFPVGVWEGPDGRSVIAALDPGAYVGQVKENLAESNGWGQRIKATGEKSGVFVDYHYFGTGDTGGAPDEKSVAKVEESVNTAGPIKVISGPADAMFKAISPEQRSRLPVYKGELMLTEHSSGSISSEAYMKRWNRKNELLADAAERASIAAAWMGGRPYPSQKLEDAWYLLLGSQMHDILPGTSLPKAYDYSWNDEVIAANQFGTILADAAESVISGLDTRGTGTCVVVYNPLSLERADFVQAAVAGQGSSVTVTGPDGKAVPAQIVGSDGPRTLISFVAKVPAVGFAAFDVQFSPQAQAAGSLRVSERELENDVYLVKLNDAGDVASIFDKKAKRELLSAPARLGLHYENPRNWPAWNQDWADRQLPAKAYVGGPATFKIAERGPARVAIEVTRDAEGSTFHQTISLAAGDASGSGGRIEFDNDIDWRTRERSLRAAFPLAVSNPEATYDIQTGALVRGNSHEKQYEYPFHKWFDLSDSKGDYGVSVMCDSKYACDKPDDHTVRLTMLHTPGTRGGYPDQGSQDLGRHHVIFALYGHAGDWRQGRSFAQGDALNQPLVPFVATAHEGSLGKTFSLMRCGDPTVSISAAKKAEDGEEVIVRLREHTGKGAKGVHIAMAKPILSAREVDGQERQVGGAKVENGELVADVGGYELRAFAVKLGEAPAKLAKVRSATVALSFDADVVSSRTKRSDGAMNAQGDAIPAEQFPASVTLEGVTFAMGSAADGQKNTVACHGQEIKLPEGQFDRLYVLAAADGDVNVKLQIDGKSVPFTVQNWGGYVGQWDRRVWPSEVSESAPGNGGIIGIDPGFIKQDQIAWYCSHHNTPKGDALYEYCYMFKYAFDLPAGAKSVRLPDDARVKVFAASVANGGDARATAARPLFDTMADHTQDGPRFVPASGSFTDATDIRIEPGLYWRNESIRCTTDGSDPTAQSPAYRGPITLSASSTVKAAVVGRDGRLGPVTSARFEIDDKTGPEVKGVETMFQSPSVRIVFSEPLDQSAADPAHYSIQPSLAVSKVSLSGDGRTATLLLARPPETRQKYTLSVSGVKDVSPAHNVGKAFSGEFTVQGPVYTAAKIGPEQRGTPIRNIAGLPIKSKDAWTMNLFVRTDKQPANRTLIAGFGKCEQAAEGGARYLAKFANGVQFWSHNRDVGTRTALSLNQWQMLTVTYDGGTLRVYKDGAKIGEQAVELADDENVVTIAPKDPWEHQRQFDGEIRDFSIWGSALGQDAIRALQSGASLP